MDARALYFVRHGNVQLGLDDPSPAPLRTVVPDHVVPHTRADIVGPVFLDVLCLQRH